MPLHIKRTVFLPEEIRATLLEGMRRSVQRAFEDQTSLPRLYVLHPTMYRDFIRLKGQFVGKTSTSEVIERVGLDVVHPSHMYRDIWFGGISFTPTSKRGTMPHSFIFADQFGQPELVVVVYLRYAGYGKEAAPIAGQVVQKWREIVSRQSQ